MSNQTLGPLNVEKEKLKKEIDDLHRQIKQAGEKFAHLGGVLKSNPSALRFTRPSVLPDLQPVGGFVFVVDIPDKTDIGRLAQELEVKEEALKTVEAKLLSQ
jgi:hypothetical protein